MSIDNYAYHIYQKHRLCIALAIIKTKPPDISVDQYIQLLKSKMVDRTDDNDVTVHSDDFIMDDDDDDHESVNILNGFNEISNGETEHPLNLAVTINSNNKPTAEDNTRTFNMNDHNTHCHKADDLLINHGITIKGSRHASNIEESPNEQSKCDKMDTNDCITAETNSIQTQYTDADKTVFNEESNVDKEKVMNPSGDSNYDSQKTILYTVHGFTQNSSHYSQSQTEMYMPNKYLYAKNRNKDTTVPNLNETTISEQKTNIDFRNEDTCNAQYIPNGSKGKIDTMLENVSNMNNSPGVIVYSSKNYNSIENSGGILKSQNTVTNAENSDNIYRLGNSQNIDDYLNELNTANDSNNIVQINSSRNFNITATNTQSAFSQSTDCSANIDEITNVNSELMSIDAATCSLNNDNNVNNTESNLNRSAVFNNCERNTEFYEHNNDKIDVDDDTETSELISYKIIEELNKIKKYLRRNERGTSFEARSTDSGYRSDCHAGTSNRSNGSQSSSINQSAFCLLNYLLHCPLVVTTRDITAAISQNFGQLIDRLHDDEVYPPFLEQLLDIVDVLIRQVHRGQADEHCQFQYKDELIQRALLLNKSGHIQKHCIQLITNILHEFHEQVTNPNVTYEELNNIDEIENICYIFHMLDIIIKRYMKKKDDLSQNSQTSQDEGKIIRKSSITDIWRRKWTPNFRDTSESSRENRCVLKECSDILNKIVVDCVNSYSLIAFSALKCFNTTQS